MKRILEINRDRYNEVVRMFSELGSTRLVSDKTGLSVKKIGYILNRMGVPTPRAGRVQWPYSACRVHGDKILKMCDEGYSLAKIAKAVGTKSGIVKEFLRNNGVTKDFPTQRSGEQHYAWKGRLIDANGYVLIHKKSHPHARKYTNYVFEHRLVMEAHLGRPLERCEAVHHIDGNKQNNSIENLELFENNAAHLRKTLKEKVPNWTEQGKENIRKAVLRRWSAQRAASLAQKELGAVLCM